MPVCLLLLFLFFKLTRKHVALPAHGARVTRESHTHGYWRSSAGCAVRLGDLTYHGCCFYLGNKGLSHGAGSLGRGVVGLGVVTVTGPTTPSPVHLGGVCVVLYIERVGGLLSVTLQLADSALIQSANSKVRFGLKVRSAAGCFIINRF